MRIVRDSAVPRRSTAGPRWRVVLMLMVVALVGPLAGAGVTIAGPKAAQASVYHPDGPTGTVYRLYRAYFDREPDRDGYDFWLNAHRTGYPLENIAADFSLVPEFRSRYGQPTDRQFLELVYRNVLDRAPDQGGQDYWLGHLAEGMLRGALMIHFSDSAEFRAKTAAGVPLGYTIQPPTTTDEQLLSVRTFGATGDGANDDTAAIRTALDAVAARGVDGIHFPPGTYKLTGVIDVPDAVQVIDLADGAVVRQFANDSAFHKVGDVGARDYSVTAAGRGATSLTLDSTAGLVAGDWFYFGSDDHVHPGKEHRRGYLRRIQSVDGNRVTIDRPLHSALTAAPRGWEVTLAPPVEIRGGTIEQHDPYSKREPILLFELVDTPQVTGTEIRDCGGSGIKTLGTVGGVLDAFVHDCLDDHAGKRYGTGWHYGYGVEAAGPTRDLVVRGRSTRTRHAFTTNSAYGPHSDKRILRIGEPEHVTVSMDVWETTSSGLDTHEVGWKITFRDCTVRDAGVYAREGSTDGKEGGFGMFLRARGTVVDHCVVERSAKDGLTVASPAKGLTPWPAADGPRISNTQILSSEGTRGIMLHQPAHLQNVTVDGGHQLGVHLHASGAGSTATDSLIDLRNHPKSIGVLNHQHLDLRNVTIRNANTPVH